MRILLPTLAGLLATAVIVVVGFGLYSTQEQAVGLKAQAQVRELGLQLQRKVDRINRNADAIEEEDKVTTNQALAFPTAAGQVVIPAGTTLAAGAFYLFGGGSYSGAATADQSFSASLASSAGGLALRNADGAIVDSVGYGTATNAFVEGSPAAAPPVTAAPGSSAQRSPDGYDTDNNAADFAATASPSPRASDH